MKNRTNRFSFIITFSVLSVNDKHSLLIFSGKDMLFHRQLSDSSVSGKLFLRYL